jgi:putative aminopeptidase FrvX
VAIPDLLQRLLTAPGPSGHEDAPARIWREAAAAYGEVSTDALGSSVVRVGDRDAPLLAVVGHIDEIGIIVTHADERGFLSFRRIGGFNPEVLVGQRVRLLSRGGPLHGVIARSKLASTKTSEKLDAATVTDLHLDIGARDRDEALELVRPGDVGVVEGDPVELRAGRIVSRALDNRVGAYAALEVARLLSEAGSGWQVAAVAAAQEELGGHGARTAIFGLEPRLAIVFDVTWATDIPGADPKDDGDHRLGSGPAILRGTTMSPRLSDTLIETADAEGIPYTIEVSGGPTYSDADVIHLSRAGIVTGLVSIPLRYMHSAIEMVDLADVDGCAQLVAAFARRTDPGTSFARGEGA